MDSSLNEMPLLEDAWKYLTSSEYSDPLSSSGDIFDLSSINVESEIGKNFVEDLLSEISTSECESVPKHNDCTSPELDLENVDWHDSDCASVASFSTASSSIGESGSQCSDDEGFISLDQCSASLSDFLDPNDFNALLDTLTASLPNDLFSTPVVLDDACYNLAQCSSQVHSVEVAVTSGMNSHTKMTTNHAVKPDISYIELVAKAIMASSDNSVLLADIYQWIENNYPYYKYTKNSWRNSIRHNLSVNECFVKSKRVKNGRGFYWSIHSSCIDAFKRGDFDRRKARRQVQDCNRAFSSAFEELQGLTKTPFLMIRRPPRSTPYYDQQFQVGARTYLPPSSTPVRGRSTINYSTSAYSSYYGPY
mgnify:CR=1 FL=1